MRTFVVDCEANCLSLFKLRRPFQSQSFVTAPRGVEVSILVEESDVNMPASSIWRNIVFGIGEPNKMLEIDQEIYNDVQSNIALFSLRVHDGELVIVSPPE